MPKRLLIGKKCPTRIASHGMIDPKYSQLYSRFCAFCYRPVDLCGIHPDTGLLPEIIFIVRAIKDNAGKPVNMPGGKAEESP